MQMQLPDLCQGRMEMVQSELYLVSVIPVPCRPKGASRGALSPERWLRHVVSENMSPVYLKGCNAHGWCPVLS